MLTETEEVAPRRGKRQLAEPLGNSMKREGERRSRGRGEFSYLREESPCRPVRNVQRGIGRGSLRTSGVRRAIASGG